MSRRTLETDVIRKVLWAYWNNENHAFYHDPEIRDRVLGRVDNIESELVVLRTSLEETRQERDRLRDEVLWAYWNNENHAFYHDPEIRDRVLGRVDNIESELVVLRTELEEARQERDTARTLYGIGTFLASGDDSEETALVAAHRRIQLLEAALRAHHGKHYFGPEDGVCNVCGGPPIVRAQPTTEPADPPPS